MKLEPVENVYGPLTGDPIQDEQMLFDAIATVVDKIDQTSYTGSIKIEDEPFALGYSPEVRTLMSISERLGIVFDYLYADGSDDVFIIVYE